VAVHSLLHVTVEVVLVFCKERGLMFNMHTVHVGLDMEVVLRVVTVDCKKSCLNTVHSSCLTFFTLVCSISSYFLYKRRYDAKYNRITSG